MILRPSSSQPALHTHRTGKYASFAVLGSSLNCIKIMKVINI